VKVKVKVKVKDRRVTAVRRRRVPVVTCCWRW